MADRFDSNNRLLRQIAELIAQAVAGISPPLGYTPENVANKSTDVNLGNSDVLYPTQNAVRTYANLVEAIAAAYTNELTINHSVLTYDANTVIDMTGDPNKTETLTGNVSFTTTNRPASTSARSVTIRLIASGADRTLAFHADWTFVGGAAPTTLVNGKVGILTVTSFGTAEADIVAAYAVEP